MHVGTIKDRHAHLFPEPARARMHAVDVRAVHAMEEDTSQGSSSAIYVVIMITLGAHYDECILNVFHVLSPRRQSDET